MKINKDNYFSDYEYLSSHSLQDFIKCEHYYLQKAKGKVKDLDSTALTFGSAVHDIISGDFNNKYFVGNKRSKAEKEEYQKNIDEGKKHLTPAIMKSVESCIKEMERQPLFNKYSVGEKEKIVITEIKGVKVKGMIDVLNLDKKFIVDWKTTKGLKYFNFENYYNQLAFYRMIVEKKYGVKCKCLMGVVDKTLVKHFRMFKLVDMKLDRYEDDLLQAIELYKLAVESGEFNKTYDDNNCLDCNYYSRCKFAKQYKLKLI